MFLNFWQFELHLFLITFLIENVKSKMENVLFYMVLFVNIFFDKMDIRYGIIFYIFQYPISTKLDFLKKHLILLIFYKVASKLR